MSAADLLLPAGIDRAVCADHERFDPDWWFSPRRRDRERVKAICLQCPARKACRSYAMARHPQHGIWAATTRDERARELRRGAAVSGRGAP